MDILCAHNSTKNNKFSENINNISWNYYYYDEELKNNFKKMRAVSSYTVKFLRSIVFLS